jgi:hypothetical protein
MVSDGLNQVPEFKYLGSIFTEDGKNKNIIQGIKEAKLCLIIKNKYSVRITLFWK